MKHKPVRRSGITAALASSLFLGFTPIFGKQAILLGVSPLAVVALRTGLAAGLLLVFITFFRRSYLYIYPAGLMGCGLAGALNGIGSVLYYLALSRLNANIGQLLYSFYPVFLMFWSLLEGIHPSRMTQLRTLIAIVGLFLLTALQPSRIDWLGVALMLGASAMYAIHIPINQRVLYDVPAPTVTFYTLLAMTAVTLPVFLIFHPTLPATTRPWLPILGLTFVTLFSRLTLFLGVKKLGGIQTALLSLSELLVALALSALFLHEGLLPIQWAGAFLLCLSMGLLSFDKLHPDMNRQVGGVLGWLRPPSIPPEIPWG
jgi:drug/metabolite transporter (DMT)-like permease